MPGLVSEDVPSAPGPNGSMPFGQATESARLQREIQSRTGNGNPPSSGGTQGALPNPSAVPLSPQQPQVPQPPVQPQAPAPVDQGRLDMNVVFPPMPEMQPEYPWRNVIRAAAYHPLAGPALGHFADQIELQRGPNG